MRKILQPASKAYTSGKWRGLLVLAVFIVASVVFLKMGSSIRDIPTVRTPSRPFYFGASLSAHQVEGNNVNSDWWSFEQTVLKKKGVLSGQATDHYRRFDEDFRLAEELGQNAHRFSIEWARIEPTEGAFDEEALKHYHEVFASLEKHHLTPLVTLFHFSLPVWFAEKGGFEKEENIRYFVRYVTRVTQEYRDEMKFVFTINEPNTYAYFGYMTAEWPPAKNDRRSYDAVMKNLAQAHREAYRAIKAIDEDLQVGVAKDYFYFTPERPANPIDRVLCWYTNWIWNQQFLDRTRDFHDFLGINYYFHRIVKYDRSLAKDQYQYPAKTEETTDLGWEVDPEGIYWVLKEAYQRYRKPIIITENGVADAQDRLRGDYIAQILEQTWKAKEEGADVFGYLHWALTDNFEWIHGFEKRFGLIEIDYRTFTRTIRPSARRYQELIESYQKRISGADPG